RQALGDEIKTHFPTVFAACMAAGIDPRQSVIPVAPAMHYHMGGILSDTWGRASLNGLSVCGECSSTGAHGANRLASNSLLEAVVMAARIADRLRESELGVARNSTGLVPADLPDAVLQDLREDMATHCGVVRNASGLSGLLARIEAMEAQYPETRALCAARIIAKAALARQESRGGHYRADFPETDDAAVRTFTSQGKLPAPELEPVA
ncbi:MAG: FAD-binding protein, partial [Pseudomonadota bacterium]